MLILVSILVARTSAVAVNAVRIIHGRALHSGSTILCAESSCTPDEVSTKVDADGVFDIVLPHACDCASLAQRVEGYAVDKRRWVVPKEGDHGMELRPCRWMDSSLSKSFSKQPTTFEDCGEHSRG